MNRKLKIKLSVAVALLVLNANCATAQEKVYDTTTTNRLVDIMGIASTLFTTPYFSFDATYYMTDVDSVTVKDTMIAKYKINGDSMYLLILKDTLENIQNKNCVASIYHSNKSIVVQKPQPLIKQVLQIDVMDTIFQNMAMAGMTFIDSSCDRSIIISFDTNAVYNNFQLHYCKLTNRLFYISYSIKKNTNGIDPNNPYRTDMYILFSNYQTGAFNNSVFSTDQFIKINSTSDVQLATGVDPAYEIVNFLDESTNAINNTPIDTY